MYDLHFDFHCLFSNATQVLNADAKLFTTQDLLLQTRIKTTERYRKVSNLKVHMDYSRAMEAVMQRRVEDSVFT